MSHRPWRALRKRDTQGFRPRNLHPQPQLTPLVASHPPFTFTRPAQEENIYDAPLHPRDPRGRRRGAGHDVPRLERARLAHGAAARSPRECVGLGRAGRDRDGLAEWRQAARRHGRRRRQVDHGAAGAARDDNALDTPVRVQRRHDAGRHHGRSFRRRAHLQRPVYGITAARAATSRALYRGG